MEGLFGGLPDVLRFAVAFLVVLGLIGGGAALWRRLRDTIPRSLAGHGRQPRLAVIDTASLDAKRILVLIRRDETEHLLMIGGPTDIVIEPNIARAGGVGEAWKLPVGEAQQRLPAAAWPQPIGGPRQDSLRLPRETIAGDPMQALRTDLASRLAPPGAAEAVRPDLPPPPTEALSAPPEREAAPEPVREPPPPVTNYEPVFQTGPDLRQPPPLAVEPPWSSSYPRRQAAPGRLPADPSIQAAAEPLHSSAPALDPERAADAAPGAHRTPPPLPPQPGPSDEVTLAEMAQRLEAALRRPTRPVEPAPPPLVPAAATAPPPPGRATSPLQPDAAAPPARSTQFEPPFGEAQSNKASGSTPGAPVIPEPAGPPLNLESEIANLIPRPAGKT